VSAAGHLTGLHAEARRLVERLQLRPHPEGGLYREVFRSHRTLPLARGSRSALTAIHFVLPAGAFSAFHRVASDEVWSFQGGDPLELFVLGGDGALVTHRLGRDLDPGQEPLAVVPAGAWQAAVPLGERYSWCSCLVAPGFDFADFEMASRADLETRFPQHADLVRRLTRPSP
jgi:predicted cupin superfamily sugar epimerase